MGEKWPKMPGNAQLPRKIQGSFTCCKSTTWDKRLYFPSDGRRTEYFFVLKNPGLNLRTWVPKASNATSRPPKPLMYICMYVCMYVY